MQKENQCNKQKTPKHQVISEDVRVRDVTVAWRALLGSPDNVRVQPQLLEALFGGHTARLTLPRQFHFRRHHLALLEPLPGRSLQQKEDKTSEWIVRAAVRRYEPAALCPISLNYPNLTQTNLTYPKLT